MHLKFKFFSSLCWRGKATNVLCKYFRALSGPGAPVVTALHSTVTWSSDSQKNDVIILHFPILYQTG